MTLKGGKPPPAGYPTELKAIGDHVRKRRIDLGLRQKDLAELLAVDEATIYNWEQNRTAPAQWQWPQIIAFLGYVPFIVNGSLPERLKAYRRRHGLSQKRLAVILKVDPSTVLQWEQGGKRPTAEHANRIATLVGDEPSQRIRDFVASR